MSVAASSPERTPEAGACTPTRLGDYRIDAGTCGVSVEWVLRRNCSLSPSQFVVACLGIGGVALAIALFFWCLGATLVMPFACIELLALGACVLVHARHALDGERLLLRGGRLLVERMCGAHSQRLEFDASSVRIAAHCGDALIELSGGGRQALVGRFVAPALRRRLASELRGALRTAAA